MRDRINDTKSCETCSHCMGVHLKRDGKYCRGMLHYCKARKKIVDKDDKCRKWQQFEPQYQMLNEAENNMDAILARLKVRYNY